MHKVRNSTEGKTNRNRIIYQQQIIIYGKTITHWIQLQRRNSLNRCMTLSKTEIYLNFLFFIQILEQNDYIYQCSSMK